MRRRLMILVLGLPALGSLAACDHWDWRDSGRTMLDGTCRAASNCSRSCDGPQGKAMGNCDITPEAH
ncbi:hypothetical protein [Zavarzinia sp.]|uniref:hypothetical protein n=1 Tax=Zavarzinia sp. TaxID=2027920 RepID=UPI003561CD0E